MKLFVEASTEIGAEKEQLAINPRTLGGEERSLLAGNM